jgi:hypothetical protein
LPIQLIPYHQYTVNAVIGALLLGIQCRQMGQKGFHGASVAVDQESLVTPWLIACWLTTVALGFRRARAAERIRLEKQAQEQRQQEVKRRKELDGYLKNLSNDFPKAWKSVHRSVERGSGSAYDEACRALVDFSEAYKVHANNKRFQEELKKFMADHRRRKALVQRLVKAGIWED